MKKEKEDIGFLEKLAKLIDPTFNGATDEEKKKKLAKLIDHTFNGATDEEKKKKLTEIFSDVANKSQNYYTDNSRADYLVVNKELLKIVKFSTFESLGILAKDGAVPMTEVEVLEKMKSLRSCAFGSKNNNNNSNI